MGGRWIWVGRALLATADDDWGEPLGHSAQGPSSEELLVVHKDGSWWLPRAIVYGGVFQSPSGRRGRSACCPGWPKETRPRYMRKNLLLAHFHPGSSTLWYFGGRSKVEQL